VTFRLDGEVTVAKLSDAFDRFAKVLDELERNRGAHLRWIVADLSYGSALATARAEPTDEDSARLVPMIIDDFMVSARQVKSGDVDGTGKLLRLVRDLAGIADQTNRVVLETADDEVIFDGPSEPLHGRAVDEPQTTKSLGTVRGRVETLSHRRGLRFTLYELASDRAVSCYLQGDHEEIMRDSWGRVADVTGLVSRDARTGRPYSIRRVTRVDIVDEGSSAEYRQARGAIGGSEPAEAIVRRIRDAS
jgi:hypothetical protein